MTQRAFPTYHECRAAAQREANATGFDFGLEHNKLFREYVFFMLPDRQHRSGHELRCEVVSPENIGKTQPGHGHSGGVS